MFAARILAAGLALAAPGPAPAADCALDPHAAPTTPILFKGLVRGPASDAEVAEQTQVAVARTRAIENPAYAKMPRVFAFFIADGARHGTIAAVTDGDMPGPGEVVTLASRHRDFTLPCAFAPWTVIRDAKDKPSS